MHHPHTATRERPLRPAVDTPSRHQGLLGHGTGAGGDALIPRHVQRGAQSLGMQLEEYASGKFERAWFALAYKKDRRSHARRQGTEILARAISTQPRKDRCHAGRDSVELFEWSRPAGGAQALVTFTPRDWRDLQVFSTRMDGRSVACKGCIVSRLADKARILASRQGSFTNQTGGVAEFGFAYSKFGTLPVWVSVITTPFITPFYRCSAIPILRVSPVQQIRRRAAPLSTG